MAQPSDLQRERFWQDLIERFDHRLRAYLQRARWNPGEIEDLVWDIWGAAVEFEESFANCHNPWSILRQLAADASASHLRVRRHELSQGDSIARLPSRDHLRESPDEAQLRRAWIDRALGQLSEKQRLAVDYRHRWGWPYWAVAAAVGTAEPTARVHAMRGLERLRRIAKACPPPLSRGEDGSQ